MIAYPPHHDLGKAIKGKLRRLGEKNVNRAAHDVRGRDGGKVIIEREKRHAFLRIVVGEKRIAELVHSFHGVDGGVGKPTFVEFVYEGLPHMLVVPGVQENLHGSVLDQGGDGTDERRDEFPLGTRPADGNEKTEGRLLFVRLSNDRAADPAIAVGPNVGDEVVGTPVSGDAHVLLRHAHPTQVAVVSGPLHQVETSRGHDEPLRMVVDDQVDDLGKPRGDGGARHETVGAHDGGFAVESAQEGRDELSHLVGGAEAVGVPALGGGAPGFFGGPADLAGDAGSFRVEGVHVLDQGRLVGGGDVQEVVEESAASGIGRSPGRGGVGDAVVAETHAYGADYEGRFAGRCRLERNHLGRCGVVGDAPLRDVQPRDVRRLLGRQLVLMCFLMVTVVDGTISGRTFVHGHYL
mmetsp:Transcript_12462/g.27428  ORF Transcript_12462/g.27428 Transcript_12462/m.27428 type:complete len:407 (+) Transcript_12462:543-1763(+)